MNLRHISIIIQGFTFFVAFSTFLGRVYFLRYFEHLGVPTSDIHVNLLDYSVISPEVTIWGIGLSATWIVFLWWPRNSERPKKDIQTFLFGAFFWVGGLGLIFLTSVVGGEADLGFGVLSIARILPFGLVLTGTLFLAPFLVFPTSQEVRVEERKSISLMQPLIWLTIAVFILLMTSSYSLSIATADAREALTEAPQARVEFASSSLHKSILQDIEDSDEPSKQWTFGVVYLGTNFAYLKSINPEVGSSGAHIYAVPIEDIVSISYVRKVEAK